MRFVLSVSGAGSRKWRYRRGVKTALYEDSQLDAGIFYIVFGVALILLAPVLAKWPSGFLNALEEDTATVVTRVVGGGISLIGVVNLFGVLF